MAYFRLTPGTEISVTFDKSQYEVGETINMTIEYSIEGKELVFGGFWTCYAEIYIDGKKYTTAGDQKFNAIGTTDTAIARLGYSLVANSAGTINGYVVAKAHSGI